MVITQEVFQEYLSMLRVRYGVEIVEKSTSPFMRAIGAVMFFNKRFMTDYITTIGSKIYWPNLEQVYMNPDKAFGAVFHEAQHAADYRWNPFIFVLTYLAPQVFFILALISVLAIFLGNWWLLWLLALLFLLPLPAIGRAIWEMRASSCGMALDLWRYREQTISEKRMAGLVARFTGPDYYYMLPSKKLVEWLAYRYLGKINSANGNYTSLQQATFSFRQRHGLKV